MIFDIKTELQLLESQPEWVGIQERIVNLNNDLQYAVKSFDTRPDKYNQKRVEKAESEIKFFENILLFWATNYKNLENLSKTFEHQVEASNNGAKLLELIDDLKEAHTLEGETQMIISKTFIELVESKGLNADQMKLSFSKLRAKINEYWKHMNKRLNDITNENRN